MSDRLINLQEAADIIGGSYSFLFKLNQRNADSFPIPVAKGRKGNPLWNEADFMEFKKRGFGFLPRQGLDNQMASNFITGKRCAKPLLINKMGVFCAD